MTKKTDEKKNPDNIEEFFSHVCSGNTNSVIQFIEDGVDVNVRWNNKIAPGATAVYIAVLQKHPETLKALIHYHANVNYRCDDGKFPLQLAVQMGNYKAIEILINHGAHLDDDTEGVNILDYITTPEIHDLLHSHFYLNDLDVALHAKNFSSVEKILIRILKTGTKLLIPYINGLLHGSRLGYDDDKISKLLELLLKHPVQDHHFKKLCLIIGQFIYAQHSSTENKQFIRLAIVFLNLALDYPEAKILASRGFLALLEINKFDPTIDMALIQSQYPTKYDLYKNEIALCYILSLQYRYSDLITHLYYVEKEVARAVNETPYLECREEIYYELSRCYLEEINKSNMNKARRNQYLNKICDFLKKAGEATKSKELYWEVQKQLVPNTNLLQFFQPINTNEKEKIASLDFVEKELKHQNGENEKLLQEHQNLEIKISSEINERKKTSVLLQNKLHAVHDRLLLLTNNNSILNLKYLFTHNQASKIFQKHTKLAIYQKKIAAIASAEKDSYSSNRLLNCQLKKFLSDLTSLKEKYRPTRWNLFWNRKFFQAIFRRSFFQNKINTYQNLEQLQSVLEQKLSDLTQWVLDYDSLWNEYKNIRDGLSFEEHVIKNLTDSLKLANSNLTKINSNIKETVSELSEIRDFKI